MVNFWFYLRHCEIAPAKVKMVSVHLLPSTPQAWPERKVKGLSREAGSYCGYSLAKKSKLTYLKEG